MVVSTKVLRSSLVRYVHTLAVRESTVDGAVMSGTNVRRRHRLQPHRQPLPAAQPEQFADDLAEATWEDAEWQ